MAGGGARPSPTSHTSAFHTLSHTHTVIRTHTLPLTRSLSHTLTHTLSTPFHIQSRAHSLHTHSHTSKSDGRASVPQGAESMTVPGPSQQLVSTGAGLPSLPKKTVDRIRSNEYIDFAELPPARGKSRQLPQVLDGQVIVLQAAHLLQCDPRPGNVESMLCSLCGSVGSSPTGKASRADGLPVLHCQSQRKIQMAVLGGLRPKFSPRCSR